MEWFTQPDSIFLTGRFSMRAIKVSIIRRGVFQFVTMFLFSITSFQHVFGTVVSFQDANFNPSVWTSAKFIDTTPGQGASFVTTTISSGGIPGSYQQALLTLREGLLRVSHLRDVAGTAFKWNPSTQGAFGFVDYSFHIVMTNYFDPAPNTPAIGGAVGYNLLLVQGGNFYISMIEAASTSQNKQWVSVTRNNLTSSDFNQINMTTGLQIIGSHPDFSSTGGEITLGYANGVSHGSLGVLKATESGIDNYFVRLHNGANDAAVPEPASATLTVLLFGLAGLASAKRKHGQLNVN
jgi:hypothetical protein